MIGSIDIRVNAARPNIPLCDMFAFQGSPSSIRVIDVPRSIGDWEITSVKLVVAYPNNNTVERVATRVGNVWVATVEGCSICGKVEDGYQVMADGIDEQGNPVEGYVLGKGNVFVLENKIDVERLVNKFTVRYLKNLPEVPSVGDLVEFNGVMKLFDGHDWISMGGGGDVYDSTITIEKNGVEVGSFTTNASEATTIDIPVPSTTSDLLNDSGFITASAIPSTVSSFENDAGYITASAIPPIPSQTSDLVNDSGYITASAIPPIPSTTNDLVNDSGFITASAIPSQVSAFENDVGYITQSAIPSNVSVFNNDAGYLTPSSSTITEKRDYEDLTYTRHLDYAHPEKIAGFRFVDNFSDFECVYFKQESETSFSWTNKGTQKRLVELDLSDSENPVFTCVGHSFVIPQGATSFVEEWTSGTNTYTITLLSDSGIAIKYDKISQFVNDANYITSSDIEPANDQYRYPKMAEGAVYAGRVMNFNTETLRFNTLGMLYYQNNTPATVEYSYAPWTLAKYFDNTFAEPLIMTFAYLGRVGVKVNRRAKYYNIDQYCWYVKFAASATTDTLVVIVAEYDNDNQTFVPVKIGDTGTGTELVYQDITLSSDGLSITEVGGVADQVTCTRTSAYPTSTSRILAYADQVPSATSQLTNDSGFITASAIPSNVGAFNNDVGYLTASTMPPIPSQTSDLENDSGFITASALSGYATENYVDGKVLALSSIYALDSDLDLVVASVSAIQTSLSTYATISYVDSQIGSINTILDNINGEVI